MHYQSMFRAAQHCTPLKKKTRTGHGHRQRRVCSILADPWRVEDGVGKLCAAGRGLLHALHWGRAWVGTVMASLMRGSAFDQSAGPAAASGMASRKLVTSGCAACSARSSPVRLTKAPRRCSSAPLMASRSACAQPINNSQRLSLFTSERFSGLCSCF